MNKVYNWGILAPGKIAHKFADGLKVLPRANLNSSVLGPRVPSHGAWAMSVWAWSCSKAAVEEEEVENAVEHRRRVVDGTRSALEDWAPVGASHPRYATPRPTREPCSFFSSH